MNLINKVYDILRASKTGGETLDVIFNKMKSEFGNFANKDINDLKAILLNDMINDGNVYMSKNKWMLVEVNTHEARKNAEKEILSSLADTEALTEELEKDEEEKIIEQVEATNEDEATSSELIDSDESAGKKAKDDKSKNSDKEIIEDDISDIELADLEALDDSDPNNE